MNGLSASLTNWLATHSKTAIAGIVLTFLFRLYSREIRQALEWPFRHFGRQVAATPARIQRSLEFARESAYNLVLFLAWNVLDSIFTDVWIAAAEALVGVFWLHLPNLFLPFLTGLLMGDIWRIRSYVKSLLKIAQTEKPPGH
jgi:hypothetical protein